MKEIKSSTDPIENIKKLFLPGFLEITIYVLSSVVLLSIFNLKVLWESVSNAAAVPVETANTIVKDETTQVGQLIDSLLDGKLTTFIFWGLMGCIVYILLWLVQNLILNIKNDVVADDYVHPRNYHKQGYWGTVVAEKLFLGTLIVVFVLLASITLKFLFPGLANLFYVAVYNFRFPVSIFEILTAVILGAILIYLVTLLARLAINTWRNIISNF